VYESLILFIYIVYIYYRRSIGEDWQRATDKRLASLDGICKKANGFKAYLLSPSCAGQQFDLLLKEFSHRQLCLKSHLCSE
jgi:hypothetical protein